MLIVLVSYVCHLSFMIVLNLVLLVSDDAEMLVLCILNQFEGVVTPYTFIAPDLQPSPSVLALRYSVIYRRPGITVVIIL